MEQSAALIALSEKDLALQRANKRLQDMPEKVAILELRRKIKEIEAVVERAGTFVSQSERAVKRAEDEAAAIQSKIDAEQSKVSSGVITNHKELQSLTREIDSLRRQLDKKEAEVLAGMERLEAGRAQAEKVSQTLAKARQKESALIVEFQSKGGEIQSEIDNLTKERHALAGALDGDLLKRYDALRESKHGIGVGVLRDGMCSACRIDLPAGKVQELSKGGPIGTCPNCHRLLIVSEDVR